MAGINWDSIMKKANACMNTQQKKQEIQTKIEQHMLGKIKLGASRGGKALHTPDEAADKFIEVLTQEINSHAGGDYAKGGMSRRAIAGFPEIKHGEPYRKGGKYYIDVYFDGDLSRESLAPKRYEDGIENIIALLNSGYDAGSVIYGTWEKYDTEERIASLISRGGAHFIENSKDKFMDNYSTEYGVEEIEISDTYLGDIATDK